MNKCILHSSGQQVRWSNGRLPCHLLSSHQHYAVHILLLVLSPNRSGLPMSIAKLQRILRYRMRSYLLPIEQARHLLLPHHRVCGLCHTRALGHKRPMFLEWPGLADLRDKTSQLGTDCSVFMAVSDCMGQESGYGQKVHHCNLSLSSSPAEHAFIPAECCAERDRNCTTSVQPA